MGLREEKKQAVWYQIRDTAWRLFEEHGYAEVSVEQIAADAQVSRSTFFNYFATKEAVVLDRSPEEVAVLTSLLEAQPPELTPWEAVTAVILGLVEGAPERVTLRRRLMRDHPGLTQRAHEMGQEFADLMRGWMRERHPEDPVGADLAVDLALAATGTARSFWPQDDPVAAYAALVRECLERAGHLAADP